MPEVAEKTTRATNTQVAKLKEGDILSYTQYFVYTGQALGKILTRDQDGIEIGISNNIVERGVKNGSQYTGEKKVSRTELINLLGKVGDSVFTANFDKISGENRTITARMVNIENGFGRSNVIDLEIALNDREAHAMRQIDHRSLHWIIFDGTRYIKK